MALKTVVLEIGSVYVKAGFAGEASPRVVYNAGLRDWLRDEGARPHHRRSTRKTTTTTSSLGEEEGEGKGEKEGEGEEDADGVVLRGGREQASDASWRALLGPLLQEVLVVRLQCRPRQCRLVVVEPLLAPSALRRAVCGVAFEALAVPAVAALLPSPLPALVAAGSLTGLLLDVGRDEARAVAVVDGRPVLPASLALSNHGACCVQSVVDEVAARLAWKQ